VNAAHNGAAALVPPTSVQQLMGVVGGGLPAGGGHAPEPTVVLMKTAYPASGSPLALTSGTSRQYEEVWPHGLPEELVLMTPTDEAAPDWYGGIAQRVEIPPPPPLGPTVISPVPSFQTDWSSVSPGAQYPVLLFVL